MPTDGEVRARVQPAMSASYAAYGLFLHPVGDPHGGRGAGIFGGHVRQNASRGVPETDNDVVTQVDEFPALGLLCRAS